MPVDSEADVWTLDTMEGTDANLADPATWQSPEVDESPSSPLEYRTLFDNHGLVFNTRHSGTATIQQETPISSQDFSPSMSQLEGSSDASFLDVPQLAPTPLCPSLALLHCIEVDPGQVEWELAMPRGRFLRTATSLHCRLLDLDSDNNCLIYEGLSLRLGFQDLLSETELLVDEARRVHEDIRNVRYLNDLLWMLQDRLDRVVPRRWPFLVAHNNEGHANLVV